MPVGSEGEVFWVGNDQYKSGTRVGVEFEHGREFTSFSNLELVSGPTLEERTKRQAAEDARQAERARLRAMVNPGQRRVVEQPSLSYWTEAWPVVGEHTDAELADAVRAYDSDASPKLRYYYHQFAGRGEDGWALVQVSEVLAD